MKIKICGLFQDKDINYVNQAMPDYIGFVFAKSRRQISVEKAKYFQSQLNPDILKVGVFVNESMEKILSIVHQNIIDMIQLHGDENQEYIRMLKTKTNLPIIKAIKVKSQNDFNFDHIDVDYYLLDGEEAGSGKTFQWEWIPDLKKPFFLAGGIHLDNIDEAIKIQCYGIDVSSGVESHGEKDEKKIKEMVRRVRNGNR